MRLKVFWVGKTRNASIRALCEEYLERARHLVPCEIVEIRDLSKGRGLRGLQLKAAEGAEIEKHLTPDSRIVVLDERGSEFSSPDFAKWFQREQNSGTRGINFIIGGPEGISEALLRRAYLSLSLGKMTWTHEMSRVLLLEQIYRAFSVLRNIPYQK